MQARVESLPLQLTALERECEPLIASEGFFLPNDCRERRPRRDQEAGVRQHQKLVRAAMLCPERRRTCGSEHDVDQQRRCRHENADGNDLKHPSLQPARQTAGPYFEESEGGRRRETEDDVAEEE
jgi:hypothetical protein